MQPHCLLCLMYVFYVVDIGCSVWMLVESPLSLSVVTLLSPERSTDGMCLFRSARELLQLEVDLSQQCSAPKKCGCSLFLLAQTESNTHRLHRVECWIWSPEQPRAPHLTGGAPSRGACLQSGRLLRMHDCKPKHR